jgi:hypothetical protein
MPFNTSRGTEPPLFHSLGAGCVSQAPLCGRGGTCPLEHTAEPFIWTWLWHLTAAGVCAALHTSLRSVHLPWLQLYVVQILSLVHTSKGSLVCRRWPGQDSIFLPWLILKTSGESQLRHSQGRHWENSPSWAVPRTITGKCGSWFEVFPQTSTGWEW